MQLRKPAVAGSFYPAQPDRLRREVVELLADARTALKITPKALIVPHAGYIYSGRVAALAFATLFDSAFARIVLIGPAHYVAIRGVAFPAIDAFETPLGHVPVDHDGFNEIKDLPFVSRNEEAHAPEHALEVELPFLQIVVPSFSLLPLVVGDATAHEVAQVLARLWSGPETLPVISSDLSHYHSYETARRLDATTAAAIENGDWASLGPRQACGYLLASSCRKIRRELRSRYFGGNKQGGLTTVLLRRSCSRCSRRLPSYSGMIEMSGKHSTEARRRYQHAMNVPSSTCSHY
jgi:AmmeMemoRadiSam system protein B